MLLIDEGTGGGAEIGRTGRSKALIAVLASSMAFAAPVDGFCTATESTFALYPSGAGLDVTIRELICSGGVSFSVSDNRWPKIGKRFVRDYRK
jgi:hypothetical protein